MSGDQTSREQPESRAFSDHQGYVGTRGDAGRELERRCIALLDRWRGIVEVRQAALVGRGDLAVDDEGPAELGQASEGGGEAAGAVEAVAREKAQATLAVAIAARRCPSCFTS
jgi:hypothetical protein